MGEKDYSGVGCLIVIMIVIAGIVMCSLIGPRHEQGKGNFEALYYHEKNTYSVLVRNEQGSLETIFIPNYQGDQMPVEIIDDVGENEPMWYEYDFYAADNVVKKDSTHFVRIHIRGADDINGAGWDHGKFGKGQTIRIDK